MGKLYYIIGKSCAGKDSVFKKLLSESRPPIKPLVIWTTRPMREGERQDRDYHFTDEEGLARLEAEGRVIERRTYDTVRGIWNYFTADTEDTDLDRYDYLGVGVLSSYVALKKYYGADRVIPVYLEVEDGIRLERAIKRERLQRVPQYAEACRRFLADSEDFSEDKLKEAGIERRFENIDFETCFLEVAAFIAASRNMC